MRLREPFNGASHLIGFVLALVGTTLLLRSADGPWQTAGFTIYGATLILLYGISFLYHSLPVAGRPLKALRTLDHIAIYFLIAGTYTPVALITLHSTVGWGLLVAVWLIALAGFPFKLFYLDAPVWLSTATYLGMGYLALVAVVPIVSASPVFTMLLGYLVFKREVITWQTIAAMALVVGGVILVVTN